MGPSRNQGKNRLRTYVLSSRAQTIYYSSSPFPIAFKLSKGHTSPFILWKKRTYSVTWWDITFEQRHFRLNDFTTTYYSLHTAGVPDRIQKHNTVDKNEKIIILFLYIKKFLKIVESDLRIQIGWFLGVQRPILKSKFKKYTYLGPSHQPYMYKAIP